MARSGGVHIELRPPLQFILKQSGAFRRELLNFTPLWTLFKPIMHDIEQKRFDEEGPGWQSLADSTIRQRERLGFGAGPIMQRTRNLMESLVDPNRAAETGPKSMSWGTDVSYAGFHQDGGSVPGRPPQRVLLEIGVEDRRKLEGAMVTWINLVSARTFGRI